jgi:hypothetical protein
MELNLGETGENLPSVAAGSAAALPRKAARLPQIEKNVV